MKTLLILYLTIHDFPTFKQYIETIPAFIAKHSGQYVVQGEVPTVIEGDWEPERVVVLGFPSRDHANGFLQDPEVQPLFAVRHQSTTSNLIMVDSCL